MSQTEHETGAMALIVQSQQHVISKNITPESVYRPRIASAAWPRATSKDGKLAGKHLSETTARLAR